MKIEIVGTNIATPGVPPATNGTFGNSNGAPRGFALCFLLFYFLHFLIVIHGLKSSQFIMFLARLPIMNFVIDYHLDLDK